jgi:hypothetical protein
VLRKFGDSDCRGLWRLEQSRGFRNVTAFQEAGFQSQTNRLQKSGN